MHWLFPRRSGVLPPPAPSSTRVPKQFRTVKLNISPQQEEDTLVPELAIAVMGITGCGKSTFINLVTDSDLPVSDSLRSCASWVKVSRSLMLDGRRVILIDTPGFDDTTRSDTDILKMIAAFLETSYKEGGLLAGVLYFHRISDVRMGGISTRNFRLFRQLCGESVLKNVVIVTNRWEEVDPQVGEAREAELMCEDLFFKPVLDKGARMARHQGTVRSAERVIRLILENHPLPLRIQEELVDQGKDIMTTGAGGMFEKEIQERIAQREREMQAVIDEMRQAMKDRGVEIKREPGRTQYRIEKEAPENLIAIMGATGSGKSTFTNLISGSNLPVSDGQSFCANVVHTSGVFMLDGHRVVLIDTPGFDDSSKSDTDILKIIAAFLETLYKEGVKLAGVLYFHRISDARMGGVSTRNFRMFRKLCGENALKNVVIVTNRWEEVDLRVGEAREAELQRGDLFFKPVLTEGARMARHDGTAPSAEKIIRLLLDNPPLPLRIQEELVDEGKRIIETDASEVLEEELQERIAQHERKMQAVIKEMRQAMKDRDEKARRELGRTQYQMEKEAPENLIAVMGATGSGKSTFTNLISGSNLPVSGGQRSCTAAVQNSGVFILDGHRVVVIDAPGFNTTKSDTDVLKIIAAFLKTSYKGDVKLAGVLYFHRISDVRVGGISTRNFGMFRKLCGDNLLRNVVIVTNRWEEVDPQVGEAREAELRRGDRFFQPLLAKGARMARHDGTAPSAEKIIRLLLCNHPLPPRIQEELVIEGKDITQTTAGKGLNREFDTQIRKYQQEIEKMKEMQQVISAEVKELQIKTQRIQEEIERFQKDSQKLEWDYEKEKERLKARVQLMEPEAMKGMKRQQGKTGRGLIPGLRRMLLEPHASTW